MKKFAHSKVELARQLEISRSGLERFFVLPNHPRARSDGRHDVKAWARFISGNAGRIATGTKTIPLGPKDDARIRLMELQIKREAVKLDRERGELLGEIGRIFERWLNGWQGRLQKLAKVELPPLLHMLTAREVQPILYGKLKDCYNRYNVELVNDLAKCEAAWKERVS